MYVNAHVTIAVSVLRQLFCCCYSLFVVAPIKCGDFGFGSLFCSIDLIVLSSFAIILLRKKADCYTYLCSCYRMAVCVLSSIDNYIANEERAGCYGYCLCICMCLDN